MSLEMVLLLLDLQLKRFSLVPYGKLVPSSLLN